MDENSDTLFPMPEDKSPRLLWMEKHNIKYLDTGYSFVASKREESPDNTAIVGKLIQAEATTLDWALQELAYKLKIKPWNWTE